MKKGFLKGLAALLALSTMLSVTSCGKKDVADDGMIEVTIWSETNEDSEPVAKNALRPQGPGFPARQSPYPTAANVFAVFRDGKPVPCIPFLRSKGSAAFLQQTLALRFTQKHRIDFCKFDRSLKTICENMTNVMCN